MSTASVTPASHSPQPKLRVIGAGLGRTGTSSVKEALEILGFGPCHHMAELPGRTGRCWAYIDAHRGSEALSFSVHDLTQACTVDHPNCDFVPELMAAFPEAKVILTVRDSPEVWWKSYCDTILRISPLWNGWLIFSVPPMFAFWSVGRNVDRFKKTYGSIGPDSYVAHNARMKALVPKEKLLVYNVKEGWAPLCTFLGVQVPNKPFPRNNETKDMHKRFLLMRIMGAGCWILELGAVYLVLRMLWRSGWFEGLKVMDRLREL
ncbi:hypothetical protein DACRYDRAFT_74382 [Dacryopinax primogenitus]|uniref:P-loop containing nucleoside triphosphate hydrolase protein n=1 Tax=Dacryopinax primogenitus (strain DJM 731) TaxID=1858805 RepID=M5GGC0_DACPD|nr:uncharacterized protein DACRYDRAFT_74382 [Dacryopinax primogenitus]EJU05223.1 hypothetical protein DACRYDRAFT_74382 [Dacryopinax primogenitus]